MMVMIMAMLDDETVSIFELLGVVRILASVPLQRMAVLTMLMTD